MVSNTSHGVKMLINIDRLKPPRVILEKGTDKQIVLPGQVFIPHSMIAELIPNYKEIPMETLRKMLPQSALINQARNRLLVGVDAYCVTSCGLLKRPEL